MPNEQRPLKVFLCHASADKPKVRELYRYLKRRGINPWLDEEDLVGGQDWQVEIPRALATSDAIIICLTRNSVDKEGYIQREIKFALDKALEMPEGRIFLIPIKFEECDVPFSLSRYQWVDLTTESGYTKMMKALRFRASQLERATVSAGNDLVASEKTVSGNGVFVEQEDPAGSEDRKTGEMTQRLSTTNNSLKSRSHELFNRLKSSILRRLIFFRAGGIFGIVIILIWVGSKSIPQIVSFIPTARPSATRSSTVLNPSPEIVSKTPSPTQTKISTNTVTVSPTALNANADVAFVSDRNGNSEIYLMGSDGSEQTLLAGNSSDDYQSPDWSFDGKQVAFIARPSETTDIYASTDIYLINSDGTGQRLLPSTMDVNSYPALSPDGKQVAFVARNPGKSDIYIMDMNGNQLRQLAEYAISPAWSPDGNKIAFVSVDFLYGDPNTGAPVYEYKISTINVDGTGLISTGTVGNDPVWSPDGSRIAFASQGEIFTMNADGTGLTRLTQNNIHAESPSWSSDGKQIVFAAGVYRFPDTFEIYVVNVDTLQVSQLTNNSTRDAEPAWRP